MDVLGDVVLVLICYWFKSVHTSPECPQQNHNYRLFSTRTAYDEIRGQDVKPEDIPGTNSYISTSLLN